MGVRYTDRVANSYALESVDLQLSLKTFVVVLIEIVSHDGFFELYWIANCKCSISLPRNHILKPLPFAFVKYCMDFPRKGGFDALRGTCLYDG